MNDVYDWLEQYAGTSYDFRDAITDIGGEKAFIYPFEWRTSIDQILDWLDEATDTVDQFWRELPDTLPDRNSLKRLIVSDTLQGLVGNVNGVCQQLNIEFQYKITTIDDLQKVVGTLSDLITMLKSWELDTILKQKMFEAYEEENDEAFSEILDLAPQDMTQLSFNVNAICQAYYESLDDEE